MVKGEDHAMSTAIATTKDSLKVVPQLILGSDRFLFVLLLN
jgi:hypothetical protein